MMKWIKRPLWVVLILLIIQGCKDDTFDLFERPTWLTGRVYTKIKEQEQLSTFARAIELIGYDTIIEKSGNYTAFGPSDEAFAAYFASNPNYSSIEQMPVSELSRIVKYHLVQNPWSKVQLRSLDVEGWIDTLSLDNNKPRGYKRETLLRDDNVKYGLKITGNILNRRISIVDTLESSWNRVVASDARKYVPIFFQEYFDIYNLKSSDYEYYFGRPFEGPNEIYYANAKIISDEIFAENGFVYIIDRVVEPLDNAYQILSRDEGSMYGDFLEVVNKFPNFNYNETKTEQQEGYDQGLQVDSLFNLSYPELAVNINTERTSPPQGTYGLPDEVTIRYHYGVTAPTNDALALFEQEYFQINNGWGSIDEAPIHIQRIVVRSYLTSNPIYQTDIVNGFYNGELDKLVLDPSSIVQKEYGSNSTFLGLDQAIIPRAFSCVAAPVYLRRGYSKIMYALQKSGLLSSLKRPDKDYMFFVPSDASTSADSSLFYNSLTGALTTIYREEDANSYKEYKLSVDDLRTLLLNHIGANQPVGLARKEFIPNLAGNFIVVNNVSGEISGTAPTRDGYNGPVVTEPDIPAVLDNNVDNGVTYDIKHFFYFSPVGMGSYISLNYNRFFLLLKRAGLAGVLDLNNNFILGSEVYTVFIPNNAALDIAQVDTLSDNDLKKLLMLHFVEGDLLFTDGNKSAGYYTTTRTNDLAPGRTQLYIEPGIDVLRFRDKNNDVYVDVIESSKSNFVAARDVGDPNQELKIQQLSTYAVVHEIDKVLMLDSLATR